MSTFFKKASKTRFLLSVLALVVLSSGTTLSASAAQTRSLPAGNTFYALDCGDDVGLVAKVDVKTSKGVLLGLNTPTPPNTNCASGGAWDIKSKSLIWLSRYNNAGTPSPRLFKTNLKTGAATEIVALGFGGELNGPKTMAIDDQGNGYAILSNKLADDLYTLNISSGAMELVGPVNGLANDYTNPDYFPEGMGCVNSFAFNPKDKNFYINCTHGPNPTKLLRLDVTTGDTTPVCDLGTNFYGIGFDSKGIGWIASTDNAEIGSFDIGVSGNCGVQIGAAETVATNEYWESDAVVIGYGLSTSSSSKSELASTGPSVEAVYSVGFAVISILAGTFLVARRRFSSAKS